MARDITKSNLKLKPYQIIFRPLVTEKGFHKAERYNAYAFEVNRLAGKDDIRRAVEELFDVKVVRVNTQNRKGKLKRTGYVMGKRPDRKRALVTLAAGDEIDIFGV